MSVLSMAQVMYLLSLHGFNVSRQTMTTKLTPILKATGYAQKIPGGSQGVWVYQQAAVPMLEKYLERQGKVLKGSPASRHSVEAFLEYIQGD